MKNALKITAAVLMLLTSFCLVSRLLEPKYAEDLVEGSMTAQYYREEKNHDVIFIGDCEVYSNFSPMELYRQAGITAYVRGNSQQLLWQSYCILRETLRYETPKAVVFNVNAMRHSAPVSEAYNRLALDTMKWSWDKVEMIQASMMEDEDFMSYVFPILRYHSRFDQLTSEDVRYLFAAKDNTFNGYLMEKGVKPVEKLPAKRPLASYEFADVCYDYLDKMAALCKEQGVELILVKAPSVYPYWYDEYDAQMEQYAEKQGLVFYNLLDHAQQMGIDYTADTYDAGLHLNLSGATKLSGFFARLLAENHGIPDRRSDPAVAALYNEKLRLYDIAAREGE